MGSELAERVGGQNSAERGGWVGRAARREMGKQKSDCGKRVQWEGKVEVGNSAGHRRGEIILCGWEKEVAVRGKGRESCGVGGVISQRTKQGPVRGFPHEFFLQFTTCIGMLYQYKNIITSF